MKIQETTELEVFQNFDCNRKLHEGNLKKLQKAILQKNLLKSQPILVDKNLNVIDGKHRLEVARRLGIPIWYQIHESENSMQDMILLNNNSKGWGIPDYLNFYSKVGGHDNYKMLNDFIEKYELDVNVALHILTADRSTGFYKDFKDGKYQFPGPDQYLNAVKKKEMMDETIEYIKKKTTGNKVYLDRVTFYSAIVSFFNMENFSYDTFFKKLQYKLDLMRPCSKREEYMKIFKEIYNWKNHSPITTD